MSIAEREVESTQKTEAVPTWLVVVLSAIIGGAVVAGAMAPMNMTPDYQRGHRDGYSMGKAEADKEVIDLNNYFVEVKKKLESMGEL